MREHDWLSELVEKNKVLLVGREEFLPIKTFMIPPVVSTPIERGVTLSKGRSLAMESSSQGRTCVSTGNLWKTATSSGLMDLLGTYLWK